MKIAIINGSMPHYDHGLGRVISTIATTLAELGMEIDEINLGFTQLPFFDGMRAATMDDIAMRLRASSGIVFACTAQLFAPSAMLSTFLEFFDGQDYCDILAEKHCLFAMVSKNGGERSALEYISRVVCGFGGYDCGQIGMQESYARSIPDAQQEAIAGSVKDIIEKTSEDFYRAVRQNRRYIVPSDAVQAMQYHVPQPMPPVQQPAYDPTQMYEQPGFPTSYPPSQPYPSPSPPAPPAPALDFDTFTEQQERDIKELTALFSQKYAPPSEEQYVQPVARPMPTPQIPMPQMPMPPQVQHQPQPQPPVIPAPQVVPPSFQNPLPQTPGFQLPQGGYHTATPPTPSVKSVKQLTQSLPHYYQPQMASGITAVIQLSITGEETFDGYLTIIDSECDYTEGFAENPEITIISDSGTWNDVLKGKYTAQKAFMIGGLKVRGNFVLLTKFDTLFKL